ncbi:carboxymuconolactone decarboxylase family protein [Roseomonas sp. GC11]|uniref:carboxymuconolactone decarboxylase family protein n=1 Tax=Roseomonas sp. GC11 TaxID=2950546 RepID=UPI00210BE74E|nr:carboxymuconolactone decarboxylase family protein [Roseomonas sp. GC11]MCQ4159456.1 carboxymuconolactone decarboxylase family protein [Roseomonas sp. GC11]
MLDWKACRQRLLAGVGHLDARTRELIALAAAISLRCDGGITLHAEAAHRAGATEAELAEALGAAINLNAGAAIAFTTRALEAFAAAGAP